MRFLFPGGMTRFLLEAEEAAGPQAAALVAEAALGKKTIFPFTYWWVWYIP